MATLTDQPQRLWLDLTEDRDQDLAHPPHNREPKLGQPETTTESAPSRLVPSQTLLESRKPASGDFSAGGTWHTSPPNVRQSSDSATRINRGGPSYALFPPSLQTNATPSNVALSGAHASKSVAFSEDGTEYMHQKRFSDHCSTTTTDRSRGSRGSRERPESQSTSITSIDTGSRCSRRFSRAEHASAIKKRDLTSDVGAPDLTKYQSTSVASQCRRLLHDCLNLPTRMNKRKPTPILESFDSKEGTSYDSIRAPKPPVVYNTPPIRSRIQIPSRTSSKASFRSRSENVRASPSRWQSETSRPGPYQHLGAEAENRTQNNLAWRPASRQRSRTRSSESVNPAPMHHATANPVPRPPHLHARSRDSLSNCYQCDTMGTRTTDASLVRDNQGPRYSPPRLPSDKVSNEGGAVVLDADRVMIEILRRIAARMEASTTDERVPVMRVTESLTREVLCICRELAGGMPMKIM